MTSHTNAVAGPGLGGRTRRRLAGLTTLALGLSLGVPASAPAAERMYALGSGNSLLSFRSDDPGEARVRRITGLPSGEVLVGLDRRPASGQIYAQGIRNRTYILSPSTGRATAVGPGPFAPALSGTSFGFDFNPMVDRIRLVSNAEQNLRLNQLTGTVAAVDGNLAYAPGDLGAPTNPASAGTVPSVASSAYTNSRAGAIPSTQLFGIDSARDTLVLQNPPNDGVLRTVGSLGVNAVEPVSFDIAASGVAYTAFRVSGQRGVQLYRISLGNGRVRRETRESTIGARGRIRGLTAVGRAR